MEMPGEENGFYILPRYEMYDRASCSTKGTSVVPYQNSLKRQLMSLKYLDIRANQIRFSLGGLETEGLLAVRQP